MLSSPLSLAASATASRDCLKSSSLTSSKALISSRIFQSLKKPSKVVSVYTYDCLRKSPSLPSGISPLHLHTGPTRNDLLTLNNQILQSSYFGYNLKLKTNFNSKILKSLFASKAISNSITTMSDEISLSSVTSTKESICKLLEKLAGESLKKTFPELPELVPVITKSTNPKFGDYQCNNAMGIWSKIKNQPSEFKNPNSVGQAIMKNFPESEIVEKLSIAGPGFINIVLSKEFTEKRIKEVVVEGVESWAPKVEWAKTAVVDFSSPNIAKEMHVGHLRSTIIGDALARILEFCHVRVLRRNHVGDWGTQFGMLIEYLFETFPNWEEIGEQAIGDLQAFYKAAKLKFDVDEKFKEKAQLAVVKLQGGDPNYRAAWKKICDISRTEFDAVYQRLQVKLEEKGESFYNPYIPDVVKELTEKNLVTLSEGAQCIFIEGQKVPLILVKSDGGFNYATTDMTALWYRLNIEKGDWIIYVTDVGQSQHFDLFFKAAKMAGWLSEGEEKEKEKEKGESKTRTSHVGFGLVLGADGKRFRTRSTEVVRLVDLLDEAASRAKQALLDRGREDEWTEEEINHAASALGYGAVKYADLKNNRLTNYTFDFDQMLDMRGNTAVYLLYAHARICSIIRKSGKNIDEIKKNGVIRLNHASERSLAIDLIRFPEVIEASVADLLPNTLCEYLYNLSSSFTTFYTNCQVIGNEEEESRLLLCEATAMVMRQCFVLLGITPLYRL